MALTKLTVVFSLSTVPTNAAMAVSHTGGWSESIWTDLVYPSWRTPLADWINTRVAMLPGSASIQGYRASQYEIQKNRLMPRGAFSSISFTGGNPLWVADMPQAALQLKYYTANQPNTTNPWLRGFPDDMIRGGEFVGGTQMMRYLNLHLAVLRGGAFGFIGRDMSQGAVRVNALAGAVLTASEVIPNVAVGDYIRLLRVYDQYGQSVQGSFQVQAIAGKVYTLVDEPGYTIIKPSGLVRKDQAVYLPISAATFHRAGTKKVGRPSEGYRGRRSRSRV